MRSMRIVAFAALAASALGCKWLEDIKKNSGPRPTGKIGDVPAGDYTVEATFGDGAPVVAGRVRVVAGGTVLIRCDSSFERCRVQ